MKQVIFFRSDKRFRTPHSRSFGCIGDVRQVKIETIDVGDNYQEISLCFDRVGKIINKLLGYDRFEKTLYLCGAVPLGFVVSILQ